MEERPFEVTAPDGVRLVGHLGGRGAPALLLHGWPGYRDYLGPCAAELGDLFSMLRYTQRGIDPSGAQGPFDIETHMADALAVLDAFDLEQAWAIGHSWGGHLALHLAVAHPDRLLGVVCISPLGAFDDVLPELHEALRARLPSEQAARVEEIGKREEAGEASDEELVEQRALLWPSYFHDPSKAPAPLTARGRDAAAGTNDSIRAHFDAGTLGQGLPRLQRLPVLFVHGIQDPLPIRSTLETAKLIPGAKVARVPQCGHLPWVDQPGFTNRALRGLVAQL